MFHLIARRLLTFGLLCSIGLSLFGQHQSSAFPASWQGDWAGELLISNSQGELQRLPMALRIQPITDSTYTYTIIYGADTPENTRPYILQVIDADRGHYRVDEQNGILLDNYLIGNTLYSQFSVMGNLLLATVEQREATLIYEIISGPLEAQTITGDTLVNGEKIPAVGSYGITIQQRAVLHRKP